MLVHFLCYFVFVDFEFLLTSLLTTFTHTTVRWKNDEAKIAYDAAIAASSSSKFIHEQGLACELAGFHYTRIEKYDTAREFFNQAKTCYNEWGSQMKVKHVTDQIVLLKDK